MWVIGQAIEINNIINPKNVFNDKKSLLDVILVMDLFQNYWDIF